LITDVVSEGSADAFGAAQVAVSIPLATEDDGGAIMPVPLSPSNDFEG
jgi:hypothetical protein